MALQGTLQDFGALETFQLIALQHKTGTLEITQGSCTRSFVFENGLLLAAHESPLKAEDHVVRFLVELDYLREEDLPAWLNFPSQQPTNPIDLLPKLSHLSGDDVVMAYDLYLQTVLDEILAWPQGRFQFHSGRLDTPSKLVGPWKIEAVLMESMRRLDELADLQAVEMPPGLVPRILDLNAVRLITDRYTRALQKWIDGRRSVETILEQSQLAGYDLCLALRQLRDQKLVEMIEWVPTGPWIEGFWQKRSWSRMILSAVGAPALLVGLTFGIYAALEHHPSPWHVGPGGTFITPEARSSRHAYAIATLQEAHRLRTGRYAAGYDELVDNGLLTGKRAAQLAADGLTWELTDGGLSYRWGQTAAASELGDRTAEGPPRAQ